MPPFVIASQTRAALAIVPMIVVPRQEGAFRWWPSFPPPYPRFFPAPSTACGLTAVPLTMLELMRDACAA
jgi:hypothetical protein